MKHITFEDYLEEYHTEHVDEGSSNGDMLQNAFESWVGNLDGEQMFELAESYGNMLTKQHEADINKTILARLN